MRLLFSSLSLSLLALALLALLSKSLPLRKTIYRTQVYVFRCELLGLLQKLAATDSNLIGRGLLLLPLDRDNVETRMGFRLLFESEQKTFLPLPA